jgi:phosphoglycolate phosphatase-like HAD superfamily hydrolase
VGDVLLSRTGGNLVIERVEVSDSVNAPVCNLTVRDYHTFLVGADELLAHNLSWCELLEKKWGREKPQELIELAEKYGYDLKYIHGHHIVMKGANDIWSAGAREILEEYGIKVIYNQTQLAAASKDELFNLAFALNNHRGIHSNAYAKAVWERLKKVVDEGLADELSKSEIADGLKDALQKMREILEKGDIFWPGY